MSKEIVIQPQPRAWLEDSAREIRIMHTAKAYERPLSPNSATEIL